MNKHFFNGHRRLLTYFDSYQNSMRRGYTSRQKLFLAQFGLEAVHQRVALRSLRNRLACLTNNVRL